MEEKKAYWEEIYSSQKKTKVEINCFDKEHSHKTKLTAGKASYVERNQALINDCDICLFYYLANYSPPKRKHPYLYNIKIASKSGTALAFKYAIQKHKKIINFADF